ncbi:MAG TPA: thioesterase family protein [Candidatus Bathyarchaeia archaeon]|nr:thioesterase family protein [Candidatus Bathyarchaeia archaeon]
MTTPWIESCRGSVPAWEVDHVGHFTVAYYHQRIEDAGFVALEALGLGPSYVAAGRRGCPTTACRVRYVHELRGGDIYHVDSGVLAIEDTALVLGHRLVDSASGTLCTTVEQRVEHVELETGEAVPLSPQARRAAESHRVEWPEPAAERRPRPRGAEGFVEGSLDTVKPTEMSVLGRSALAHYIHRFSASGGHLMAAFGMTPAYMRTEVRGLSTFEFQLAIAGPLRTGRVVRVQSALVHIGNSSLRLFHRMTDAGTGDELATLEQSGVHLDRDARRPTPLPEALRAKARAMLAPTAG